MQYRYAEKGFGGDSPPSRSSRSCNRPIRISARPTSKSAPTARFNFWIGRTRSSATCNIICAIQAAITSTAASIASRIPAGRLLKPAKIAGEPIDILLDLLKEPARPRAISHPYRIGQPAQRRSRRRMVTKWIERLDKKDPEYEHWMLETLSAHQYQNVVNESRSSSGCCVLPELACPRPPPHASFVIGATASPTCWGFWLCRPMTSTPACASKPCARRVSFETVGPPTWPSRLSNTRPTITSTTRSTKRWRRSNSIGKPPLRPGSPWSSTTPPVPSIYWPK